MPDVSEAKPAVKAKVYAFVAVSVPSVSYLLTKSWVEPVKPSACQVPAVAPRLAMAFRPVPARTIVPGRLSETMEERPCSMPERAEVVATFQPVKSKAPSLVQPENMFV